MTEPVISFTIVSITISFLALIASGAIACAAVYSARTARKAAAIQEKNFHSQMVFSALQQYDELGMVLNKLGNWSRDPSNSTELTKLLNVDNNELAREIIISFKIDDDLWIEARKIKQYFYSYFLIYKSGLIPEDILIQIINRYGYDLLQKTVYPMDIYRFFKKRDRTNTVPGEFEREFDWYRQMTLILRSYDRTKSLR